MEKSGLNPVHGVAGVCALLVGLNELAYLISGKPIVYCGLWPLTAPLYGSLALVVIYAVSAYAVLQLFRGQIIHAFGGLAIIFGMVELPAFLTNVLGHGGYCG
ncbi:hypothetical protein AMC83_CH01966 [Rhizobium phaseoli]|uniref:hypothetical protein n=1 Tax=Rhizobium phaseoli TaxID=396 RepID=UPI0007EA9E28|nr:hypothetical protein [Rhizobium phaseoli]ANL71949.1 hypothetical protein AMC83_CH01966 [Rhizobium phaseoli]